MKKLITAIMILCCLFVIPSYAVDISDEYETMRDYAKNGDLDSSYITMEKIVGILENSPQLFVDIMGKNGNHPMYELALCATSKMYLNNIDIISGYLGCSFEECNEIIWGDKKNKDGKTDGDVYLSNLTNLTPVDINRDSFDSKNFVEFGKILSSMYDERNKFIMSGYPTYYDPWDYRWDWSEWGKKSYDEQRKTYNAEISQYFNNLNYSRQLSKVWQQAINNYAEDRKKLQSTERILKSIIDAAFRNNLLSAEQVKVHKHDIEAAYTWAKSLDNMTAYYLFDCPIYALNIMMNHVLNGKDPWFDSKKEKQVEECGKCYSTLVGGVILYTTFQYSRDFYLIIAKQFKEILDSKTYKELKTNTTFQINAVKGLEKKDMARWP